MPPLEIVMKVIRLPGYGKAEIEELDDRWILPNGGGAVSLNKREHGLLKGGQSIDIMDVCVCVCVCVQMGC